VLVGDQLVDRVDDRRRPVGAEADDHERRCDQGALCRVQTVGHELRGRAVGELDEVVAQFAFGDRVVDQRRRLMNAQRSLQQLQRLATLVLGGVLALLLVEQPLDRVGQVLLTYPCSTA
jgi:hypothetical protein